MPGFQLLADFDGVIAILFAVISIGAAIVNAVGNKKEPPRRNPGRPKDSSVRKEIEEFLEQQGGRKPRREEVVDDIEVIEEPRNRPGSKSVQKAKRAPVPQRSKPASPKPAPKATPRPAVAPTEVTRPGGTPIGSTDLGTGLRDHISSAMGERMASQAQRDLPHLASRVDQQVREDLGTFSVSGKEATTAASNSPLIKMLRDPQTARNAVIIAEIMGRPKALRK